MVQSYLKKIRKRPFIPKKRGGKREKKPLLPPSPLHFILVLTKNCHIGIANERIATTFKNYNLQGTIFL